MERQQQQDNNRASFTSPKPFDMISQKSLDFPLDKLLGDTSFEMDVDALIQPPDKAFLDNYLTSLQAQANTQPQYVDQQDWISQQQQVQQQQQQQVGLGIQQQQQLPALQGVQLQGGQLQGVPPFSSSVLPITTGVQSNGAGGFAAPQIVTTGDSSIQFPVSDLNLADINWDEDEVQGQFNSPLEQGEQNMVPAIDKNKQKKRRIRSQQQQMQNKLAQQRYRERRKQKYTDMEAMVDEMQNQVDTLKQVERQFEEMQGQKDLLLQRVQEQENEINRLRNQVHQLTLSGGLGVADEQLQKCENAEVIAGLINEHDMEKVREELKITVDNIKQIMEKYNLLPKDDQELLEPAAGASISEEDTQTLSNLVCRGMAACMKLYQDASNTLMCPESRCNLRQSHMDKFMDVKCPIARSQWEKCLRVIQLSQSQIQDVLKHREQFLEKMREIYSQRDKLNLTAMGMMLPHWSKDYNPTAEGRMQTVERRDFYFFARWDAELAKVLDELRLNLREEQKAFLIFSKTIMANVLQMLQRALLIVTSYPLPVDILGIANMLFAQVGAQAATSSHSCQSASQVC